MNDRAEREIFPSKYKNVRGNETARSDSTKTDFEITKKGKALSRKIDTEKCEAILRDKLDEMSFVKYSVIDLKIRDLESRVQNFSEQDDDSTNVALKGRWIGRVECSEEIVAQRGIFNVPIQISKFLCFPLGQNASYWNGRDFIN